MSVINVSRADITAEQVTEILRAGLGDEPTVTPRVHMPHNPLGKTRPADPDTIMVARGSGRMIRAQVAISNTDGRTELHVTPGGLTAFGIINTLRIARMVHIVLQATLSDRPS